MIIMATSEKTCCVPGCGKSRSDNTVLHSFPNPEKERERFLLWVQAIGPSISSCEHHYLYKRRRVCHAHFEQKFLTWTRRLSPGAFPTLHLPVCIPSANIPMMDNTTHTDDSPDANVSIETKKKAKKRKRTKPSTKPNPGDKTPFLDDKAALKKTIRGLIVKNEKYAVRLKKAMKLSENRSFLNMLQKFTSLAALFTVMQFREVGKKKYGRRFTQPEKIMALSLYKRSPKAYRWLKNIFVLPSPLTLNRLICRTNLKAGINDNLFKQLQKKTQKMKADDKLCVLLFDEMSIAPHFDYNLRKDTISGFVNKGEKTVKKICDHALVFMIRGVTTNYKQPVAYTFCTGSTSKQDLAYMIKNVIRRLHSVGLRVLATVCDQGATNRGAIKILIDDTKAVYLRQNNKEIHEDIFEVDEQEVIPLFDPPHLIKGIRNNLMQKDLKCTIDGTIKIAKWEHVAFLLNEDPGYKGIRLVKKLTEHHVNPDSFQKMKVKLATQVMSQRVAVTMGYLAENNTLPKECTQTADIFLFFDQLFDSVNGSYDNSKKKSGKTLLQAVTPKSEHIPVWQKAKPILSSMRFIGKENNKTTIVPSILNWLRTINNVQYLIKTLADKYEIKSVWMRHFNQDPLENFFGSIRSHGCRNTNPTPAGFESSFASLLITNLSGQHSIGSNCEEDTCELVFKTMNVLFKNPSESAPTEYMHIDGWMEPFETKKNNPRIIAQLQYVAGYILKKTKINVFKNCRLCKNCLYDENSASGFLKIREYKKGKYHLTYPSSSLVEAFSRLQDLITYVLKSSPTIPNIKTYLKTLAYVDIEFDFITCEEHKSDVVDYIIDLSCKFFIFNWCKDVNKILNGTKLNDHDADDEVKVMAREYFMRKRHHKIKK